MILPSGWGINSKPGHFPKGKVYKSYTSLIYIRKDSFISY
jgi:hypothetical protein